MMIHQKFPRSGQRELTSLKSCAFFGCEKSAEESSWHQCQTLFLHKEEKTIAIELAGHKVLAKLKEGDMAATEAVYHLKCLNELYNKYRSFCKTSFRKNESNFIEGTYNNILAIQALSTALRKRLLLCFFFCFFLSVYTNEMIHIPDPGVKGLPNPQPFLKICLIFINLRIEKTENISDFFSCLIF